MRINSLAKELNKPVSELIKILKSKGYDIGINANLEKKHHDLIRDQFNAQVRIDAKNPSTNDTKPDLHKDDENNASERIDGSTLNSNEISFKRNLTGLKEIGK